MACGSTVNLVVSDLFRKHTTNPKSYFSAVPKCQWGKQISFRSGAGCHREVHGFQNGAVAKCAITDFQYQSPMRPKWIHPNDILSLDFQLGRNDHSMIRKRTGIKGKNTFILPVFLIITQIERCRILVEGASQTGILA